MHISTRTQKSLLKVWVLTTFFILTHASAQYNMTVPSDRLINATNEPHNWLLMDGRLCVNTLLKTDPN
jgi:alcohol dehydrogenase (cytochrome c)